MMEMADHYIFLEHHSPEQNRAAFREAAEKMRERGMQDIRITAVDLHSFPVGEGQTPHGFFVEGWSEKQRPQYPPFNPPVMYADE